MVSCGLWMPNLFLIEIELAQTTRKKLICCFWRSKLFLIKLPQSYFGTCTAGSLSLPWVSTGDEGGGQKHFKMKKLIFAIWQFTLCAKGGKGASCIWLPGPESSTDESGEYKNFTPLSHKIILDSRIQQGWTISSFHKCEITYLSSVGSISWKYLTPKRPHDAKTEPFFSRSPNDERKAFFGEEVFLF